MAEPEQVAVPAAHGSGALAADLVLPQPDSPLVVFAHGSGSSRHSERNRWVAARLQEAGLGTLLLDLLTDDECERDAHGEQRFNIPLLTVRVLGVLDWWRGPLSLFGASTGAAAALGAAARRPDSVRAVVSRGGRPDLTTEPLDQVRAPTLMLVGGSDPEVLELNRRTAGHLSAEHELQVVPGATHLFEEPGALAEVARATTTWFTTHP
ncbi:dienelactone hydrolase family protein [Saccharopolyspora sp. 6T]|uniref:dienelactone hydrolase family protein n=1 Tax=Saccharopolyspora sp. 6T TaxID=2877238 RepID=UPI001CD81388|nr:alpha/beta family hydrolase [Saccharopolyspora sp. 6T]MCA1189686.1 dienelactone hydrolase family protein [Saccharopolyspora sp. 6T]